MKNYSLYKHTGGFVATVDLPETPQIGSIIHNFAGSVNLKVTEIKYFNNSRTIQIHGKLSK